MATAHISHTFVDTDSGVLALVEAIQALPKNIPCLYIDLEGIRLSRNGSISLVTLFIQPQNCVYLLDVHKLQTAAFDTASPDGTTLKSIFQSSDIIKVFFDVRNDSDALYHHFGVALGGVEDIQLMENAVRPTYQRRYVNGLDRCITRDAPISAAEKHTWRTVKDNGIKLFHPEKGGSYEIFNLRPINADIERYCVLDVQYLPLLRNKYWSQLNNTWKMKVVEETNKRVRESQRPAYDPHAETKKFGPWGNP